MSDPQLADMVSKMPWSTIRIVILARDSWVCSYCVDPATEVDHILAVARGGSNHPSNLAAACKSCNCCKGALTPEEWAIRDGITHPPWWDGNLLLGPVL